MTDERRERRRAGFLAAVMVLSVFGGTVALGGAAGASASGAAGVSVTSAVEYDSGTVEITLDDQVRTPNGVEFYDSSGTLIHNDTGPTPSNDSHTFTADADGDLLPTEDVTVSVVDSSGTEVVSNASVTTTSATAHVDADGPSGDLTTYRGGPIALNFTANTGTVAAHDVAYEVLEDGSSILGPFRTGENSTVAVLDTDHLSTSSDYEVLVDDVGDDDDFGDNSGVNVSLRSLQLSVSLDSTAVSTGSDVTGTVSSVADRNVTVVALDADDTVVESHSVTVGASGENDFTFTGLSAGTYAVRVADDETTATATSDELTVGDDDGSDDDGDSDDGGSGSSDGGTTTIIRERPSDTAPHDPASIRESYDVTGGEPIYAESRDARGGLQSERDVVTFTDDSPVDRLDFANEVTGSSTVVEFDRLPARIEAVPGQQLRAFRVSMPPAAEGTAPTVRARVPTSFLDETGAGESDLAVLAYDGGVWTRLDASPVEGDDEVLLDVAPGDASFLAVAAVSAPEPNAHVAPATVEPGRSVTLDAGESNAEFGTIEEYEWSVGDRRLSGETATLVLDEPGEYDVELSVTTEVGEPATSTATVTVVNGDGAATQSQDASESTTTADGSGPGFGVVAGLIALLVAALLARRIR